MHKTSTDHLMIVINSVQKSGSHAYTGLLYETYIINALPLSTFSGVSFYCTPSTVAFLCVYTHTHEI